MRAVYRMSRRKVSCFAGTAGEEPAYRVGLQSVLGCARWVVKILRREKIGLLIKMIFFSKNTKRQ